jgi:hypothetical protein
MRKNFAVKLEKQTNLFLVDFGSNSPQISKFPNCVPLQAVEERNLILDNKIYFGAFAKIGINLCIFKGYPERNCAHQ